MNDAIVNRRAFGLATVCTLAVYSQADAAPVPAPVNPPPVPDPIVEFDGKAHLNPKVLPGGVIVATGVVRPPKDWKILHVEVKWQKNVTPNNVSRIQNAIMDMTVDPPTWKIQIEKVEPGEYWFDTNVMCTTPDGTKMRTESFDKRRVWVNAPS